MSDGNCIRWKANTSVFSIELFINKIDYEFFFVVVLQFSSFIYESVLCLRPEYFDLAKFTCEKKKNVLHRFGSKLISWSGQYNFAFISVWKAHSPWDVEKKSGTNESTCQKHLHLILWTIHVANEFTFIRCLGHILHFGHIKPIISQFYFTFSDSPFVN